MDVYLVWDEKTRRHVIGSNNPCLSHFCETVSKCSFGQCNTTHASCPYITQRRAIPQNRKTLTCWRTDVMWLLWLLPLPGDGTTIEAAPKELSNMCVFLGIVFFQVVAFQQRKYITMWWAASLGHCTWEHLSAESTSLSKDCKQVPGKKLSYN